ncbi:MAG TPA: hypothetical protein DDW94_03775 [Deltaproteobacteria bacterium]|nr:MAG: hypothetical protein A2Z79_11005 [Deltaproteobacteria bacterium GWA2_55_82]OIJ72811.1 MAG: hypothetical protein A2V21_300200 [Deltaproteobacteria bacterium GWC2_55_46]HBG46089.1 hypothetical protein [Deltaproteobacteria bacterium]HCY11587.1 hypothetical protein [Deltaproteobacteria bacterium]
MGKWAVAALSFVLLLAGPGWTVQNNAEDVQPASLRQFSISTAHKVIARWPEASRKAAVHVLDKYGAPDLLTNEMLIWMEEGEWQEIIVRKRAVEHRFPVPHDDVLEQSIAYEVPEDKFDDLAVFNGSVIAERTRGTLSSRCASEAMNYLALNLANDIITNSKSVEEARAAFADILKELMEGRPHPYTTGLKFRVYGIKETSDPDYSIYG